MPDSTCFTRKKTNPEREPCKVITYSVPFLNLPPPIRLPSPSTIYEEEKGKITLFLLSLPSQGVRNYEDNLKLYSSMESCRKCEQSYGSKSNSTVRHFPPAHAISRGHPFPFRNACWQAVSIQTDKAQWHN